MLAPHRERFSWDAPIHSIADIEALPYPPRMVNIKPSRLGGLRSLLDAYDYCAARGIGNYGGGQFELGVGRGSDPVPGLAVPPRRPQRRGARPASTSPTHPRTCRPARSPPRPARRLPLGLSGSAQRNFRATGRFANSKPITS